MKNLVVKCILYGVVTWIVPFFISFLFYQSSGQLAINYDLFKSIMLIISTLTGITLLYYYMRAISSRFIQNAVVVGFTWLLVNYILDFLILLPFTAMGLQEYFYSIGLRYFVIPIYCIGVGYLADHYAARK